MLWNTTGPRRDLVDEATEGVGGTLLIADAASYMSDSAVAARDGGPLFRRGRNSDDVRDGLTLVGGSDCVTGRGVKPVSGGDCARLGLAGCTEMRYCASVLSPSEN